MNFEEILKRISPKLKRITYKLYSGFAYFNDEDLYQEAAIHLWLRFKQGILEDKTDSYILQGCYFHLKNHIRKKQPKTIFISLNNLTHDEEQVCLNGALALEDEQAKCFREDLSNNLLAHDIHNNGFTEREKKVLQFVSEGQTVRQIGNHLGASHVSIVKLMKKIRGKSKRYIDWV